MWWQPADESEGWALHDTPESNSAGLWRAKSGAVYHEYDPAALLRDYGTGTSAGSVTSSGRWAAREYDYTTLATSSALGAPWLHWMAGGWLHIAVTIDSIVRYYWVEPFRATPILREADAHPFGEEGGFQNPFITSYACGWLLVGATEEEGYMRLSRSERFGDTWEEVSGGTLVDDLRNGCVDISDGFLISCGWKDGDVLFRTTSGREFTPEAIHYGGPTETTICSAPEDARSQVFWLNGRIEALVEGVGYYRSLNWGTTWTQVPPPHVGDGMGGGTATFIDGEVLVSGVEAGEVRIESAYREVRTPEEFWFGGPTHLAVTEGASRNAIEAVHGERWVATGEDGISLYRLRNPATGFEKIISGGVFMRGEGA